MEDIKDAPTRKEPSRHRVQLDFSPKAHAQLEEIRAKAGARTNAELVRSALRLYEYFLDKKKAGVKLQFVEGDIIKEVELLV